MYIYPYYYVWNEWVESVRRFWFDVLNRNKTLFEGALSLY